VCVHGKVDEDESVRSAKRELKGKQLNRSSRFRPHRLCSGVADGCHPDVRVGVLLIALRDEEPVALALHWRCIDVVLMLHCMKQEAA